MLLSIVVPCFNARPYLKEMMDSIDAAGGAAKKEVILVNDGSTDGSLELIEAMASRHDYVSFISMPNRGAAAARNEGARRAVGEFLLFLDADDVLCAGCLTKLEAIVSLNDRYDFYVGVCDIVDGAGNLFRTMPAELSSSSAVSNVLDYMAGRVTVQQGGYLIRRQRFLEAPFPENLRTQEDIPFFIASLARLRAICVPVDMMQYHKYRGAVSKARKAAIHEGFGNIDVLFCSPYLCAAIEDVRGALYRAKARSLLRYIARAGDVADVRNLLSEYHARMGVRLDLPLYFKFLKTFLYVLRRMSRKARGQ